LKASLGQTLFRTRSALAALWVFILLAFADPWISVWSALLFLPGLVIRFWAAGFIGPVSRNPKISTESLVTRGPYSISRHPLYIANALLVGAGLVLLEPHWILISLTSAGFIVLYILIGKAEEASLAERFGKDYEQYRKKVTLFFPRLFRGPLFKGFNPLWALREWQTWLVVGLLFGFACLRLYVVPELVHTLGSFTTLHLSWLKPLARAIVHLF
jgi:protein-S-isoprenylcysteine O-methyltransferase Ste14